MRDANEQYILELLGKGKREHDRGNFDYRNISLKLNAIPNAEGSAMVDIGNTKVLVGVKLDVGTPLPDKPDEGALITSAELLPLAHAEYETGPPSAEAIEFARVVDRSIRAAEVLDLSTLFIEKDKVWTTFVDIYVLNFDGNLFDAGTLAASAALLSARMPKYENAKVTREGKLGKLKTNNIVTSCTFAKLGGKLVLDPNANEEAAMDCRLTVGVDETLIRAMQKGQSGSLSFQEIKELIDVSFDKSKHLRDIVKKAISD